MAARLWLVLLCAFGLVWPPAASVAAASPTSAAVQAELPDVPELTPDQEAPIEHLRSSEGVELLVGLGRLLANGRPRVMAPAEEGAAEVCPEARRPRRGAGWCDLVQCRRLSGARLLRYATAPPQG